VRAKKHLGQHFLRNRHQIEGILDALAARPGDPILEIGPGPGSLTLPLNERGLAATLVEYDRDMVDHLAGLAFDPPMRVIHADFMDLDLAGLIVPGTRVLGNLPYNVSVPITARLLEAAPRIRLMVLMYQKEVAERIRAAPNTKAYGLISVLARCFFEVAAVMNLKPGSFQPSPKVDSQVLCFRPLPAPLIATDDLAALTGLLRFLFSRRRKMVSTSLKKWDGDRSDPDTLLQSLTDCGIDPASRPENLAPADYACWLAKIKEYHAGTYKG